MGHFIHVSLANGTPENCFPLKWAILAGNNFTVYHLWGKQFYGLPFARETWIKWPIWGGNNFQVYHYKQ